MNGFYIAIGILLFAVQLLLCFKAEKMMIKLIPVYIILFLILFAITLFIGVFGTGFLGAERILAFLLVIGALAALIIDGLSWLEYLAIIEKQGKSS